MQNAETHADLHENQKTNHTANADLQKQEFLRLDIDVHRGDFHLQAKLDLPTTGISAIYGPSGCGKTTLLRVIAGLETQGVNGRIQFAAESWLTAQQVMAVEDRNIGFVFQRPALFPHLTVLENLEFAWCRAPQARKQHLRSGPLWVAELTGINELLQHKPAQLSGGQQQRVAIARTLLSCPQLLLMDEPLANLDRKAKLELVQVLQRVQNVLQIPILYVSHNAEEVLRLADYLVFMEKGQVITHGEFVSVLQSDEGFARLGGENVLAATVVEAVSDAPVEGSAGVNELLHLTIAGQSMRLPNPDWQRNQIASLKQRRLLIAAESIGLARTPPSDTSISNALPAQIIALKPALHPAESRVLLELADGQRCSALITKHSLQRLQFQEGEQVVMLIKAVASH
ncbi:molybdenum ABC transporter ATP-binding protein [Aliidiomarina haloalkalitolerans]|uniref:Molybdenum ABC transporter ATP-binding protein n=1 Tax=Aliidiomarina haloalkalitolerans TaxID=859059 RepID=A0A432VW69_9GAMM|nr:ATP-binding cassette domain-containing protein [Aliidiomarina haloalkalitolerans]RUO20744.1 molybdenum ABC transporter ATP-binding protein [Aliidiomarina haloalkalitolerans]